MKVVVLGSSAGGGFPQWNCYCKNCHNFRTGKIKSSKRTQSSIAIQISSDQWVLINASPDIHHQILSQNLNFYSGKVRNNPFCAIILTDSQLDHTAGLLLLREDKPLTVYATRNVYDDLSREFPVIKLLEKYCGVIQRIISDDLIFSIEDKIDMEFRAVQIHSNAPPYSQHRNNTQMGDNIGILVRNKNTDKKLLYIPGIDLIDDQLLLLMNSVDFLLIDGTFYHYDELLKSGVGTKLASEMGHLPLAGEKGLISYLNKLSKPRKILIHINNTNPILDEESPEFAKLKTYNIEVAYDGLEILL